MGIRLNGQTTGYVQIEAPATAADNTLKLPNGNGSNGQMLTTDGNGNLSFTTPASTDLINDPTPQLGGDLNVDGNSIVSANNGNIVIDPNGTGKVSIDGNITSSATSIQVEKDFNFGSTKRVVGLADPASAQDAATKSYVDTNANLAADSSPQLGGNLDVNGHDIVTTSNGDIDLDPNGSGQVVFKGNSTRGSGAVKLNCEFNSHGIVVQGPPHSAGANYTLTLPNDTGTSGQLLSTNGSGTTSWTTINASPSITATASGAISDGDTLKVNTDGTVSSIVAPNATFAVGTPSTVMSEESGEPVIVPIPNTSKFVYLYHDEPNNGYLVARVCSISGTTVTMGTKQTLQTSNSLYPIACWHETLNILVVGYRYGGSWTTFESFSYDATNDTLTSIGSDSNPGSASGTLSGHFVFYNKAADKIIYIGFWNSGGGNDGAFSWVGTTASSGTTTWGNRESGMNDVIPYNSFDVAYNPDEDFYCAIYDTNQSGRRIAFVKLNSTNTTALWSHNTSFNSINVNSQTKIAYDEQHNKMLLFRVLNDNIYYREITQNYSSGPSLGTESQATTDNQVYSGYRFWYNPVAQKYLLLYLKNNSSTGFSEYIARQANYNGTTFSVETTKVVLHDKRGETNWKPQRAAYIPDAKAFAVGYNEQDDSGSTTTYETYVNGIQMTQPITNLTEGSQFIGISDGAYANGATATVQIVGSVDDAQSGLTPGKTYYVQENGDLGLTPDTPSVIAGTAVSATKLIVKG